MTVLKNSVDCPSNSLSAVSALTAATAPASGVEEGRMTEQSGRSLLMKSQGSGRTRSVSNASPPKGASFRFGNFSPVIGILDSGEVLAHHRLNLVVPEAEVVYLDSSDADTTILSTSRLVHFMLMFV